MTFDFRVGVANNEVRFALCLSNTVQSVSVWQDEMDREIGPYWAAWFRCPFVLAGVTVDQTKPRQGQP